MIPYPAALEFFQTFFSVLPVSIRAFILLSIVLPLAVHFLVWLVSQVLG